MMCDLGSGRRKLVREKGCPYCRGYSGELMRKRILKILDEYFKDLAQENNLCVGYYDVECEALKSLVSGVKLGDTVALTNMEDASSSEDGRNKHSTLSRKAYGGQSSSPLNEDKYYVKKRRRRV